MSLQATVEMLGNIGEFVGALAVVATLIYLAIQIRQNKKSIDSQTDQNAWTQYGDLLGIIGASPQVSSVMVKGLRSMSELTEEEELQFMSLLTMALNAVEHHLRQVTDPEQDPLTRMLWDIASFYSARPGGRQYWQSYRSLFSDQFIQWVEGNLPASP